MAGVERTYEYRPGWGTIAFSGLFFAACVGVLGYEAWTNDRGLILNGAIEFGVQGATIFYWVLTALSAGFVAISLSLIYHRFTYTQRLTLGATSLRVPVSRFSHDSKEIAYRDISDLSEARVSGQRFLYVVHPGGKYTIVASMLPSKAAFAEVRDLLAAKVGGKA
jgi:hypothetical protein